MGDRVKMLSPCDSGDGVKKNLSSHFASELYNKKLLAEMQK